MSTQSEALKERTLQFAVGVLGMIDCFPRTIAADAVARQLAKSAPSVAANYRGTRNARSRKEFIAKLGVVVDEREACQEGQKHRVRASEPNNQINDPITR